MCRQVSIGEGSLHKDSLFAIARGANLVNLDVGPTRLYLSHKVEIRMSYSVCPNYEPRSTTTKFALKVRLSTASQVIKRLLHELGRHRGR